MTINGLLKFSRYVLRPIDKAGKQALQRSGYGKSIAPMDCELGIDKLPFKMTINMMIRIAYFAQNQGSYQAAEDIIKNLYNITINDDTIRLVTNYIGKRVFEKDCMLAEKAYNKLQTCELSFEHNKKGVLYIETDGAALNTRYKNEDGSTWRENKLGVVFSSDDMCFRKNKNGEKEYQIKRREYVSYVGNVHDFSKHLLSCAMRNGYGQYKETVIISDGAAWIRNMIEELFPDAQHILDYFHLCENVYSYAKELWKTDETKSSVWANDICEDLRNGNAKHVLKEISLIKPKQVMAVNLQGYIENNITHINYPEYEEKGYFIGSGAIESGNKIVLQRRLKQAGMRWNTPTAQYLLTLRSKEASGLWEKDVAAFLRENMC